MFVIRMGAAALLLGAGLVLGSACSSDPTVTCSASDAMNGCSCDADDGAEGNETECTAKANSAICCAATQWPEDGTFCECSGAWRCQSSDGSTCACQLGALVYEGVHEVETCAPAEGAICCQFWDTCNCGNGDCEEGHTQVADCSFGAVVDLVAEYRCETQRGGAAIDSCVVPR